MVAVLRVLTLLLSFSSYVESFQGNNDSKTTDIAIRNETLTSSNTTDLVIRNETMTTDIERRQACPLVCDQYGYLIQNITLYRVDLLQGTILFIANISTTAVNAMGYNPIDNYLYATQSVTQEVIRIAGDGSVTNVTISKPGTIGFVYVGDIDDNGQYWYGVGGKNWQQMDLKPGSATYGQLIANGTMDTLNRTIADWVFVPVSGRYLWSAATGGSSGGVTLMRFSMTAHTWEIIASYPSISAGTFGAQYGVNNGTNGTIYASDNSNGNIFGFVLDGTTPAFFVKQGPKSSSNDGARCVYNILNSSSVDGFNKEDLHYPVTLDQTQPRDVPNRRENPANRMGWV